MGRDTIIRIRRVALKYPAQRTRTHSLHKKCKEITSNIDVVIFHMLTANGFLL